MDLVDDFIPIKIVIHKLDFCMEKQYQSTGSEFSQFSTRIAPQVNK